jgi:hypothetical protein
MELNVSDFHSFTYYFISILILVGGDKGHVWMEG